MITREEIRQLAQFESPSGCAITFYFQPQTPQNRSHREEAILVKDLVRDALRKAERNGNDAALRQDLASGAPIGPATMFRALRMQTEELGLLPDAVVDSLSALPDLIPSFGA